MYDSTYTYIFLCTCIWYKAFLFLEIVYCPTVAKFNCAPIFLVNIWIYEYIFKHNTRLGSCWCIVAIGIVLKSSSADNSNSAIALLIVGIVGVADQHQTQVYSKTTELSALSELACSRLLGNDSIVCHSAVPGRHSTPDWHINIYYITTYTYMT